MPFGPLGVLTAASPSARMLRSTGIGATPRVTQTGGPIRTRLSTGRRNGHEKVPRSFGSAAFGGGHSTVEIALLAGGGL